MSVAVQHASPLAGTTIFAQLTVPLEGSGTKKPIANPAPPAHAASSKALGQATVQRAWAQAGLEGDGGLTGMATRARLAGLLPEARVRVLRSEKASDILDYSDDLPTQRGTSAGGMVWEGRLAFRLDKLMYSEEEVTIERLRNERRESKQKLAHKVLELVFHVERCDLEAGRVPPGSDQALDVAQRQLEAEMELDMLTGGWFSKQKRAP
jgi:hypothetical protein